MTLTSKMISGARSGHGCGLVSPGEVMVVGGDSYPDSVSTKVEVYSLATDTWTSRPPLSAPLTGSPALVTHGHSLYLLGGYDEVRRGETSLWMISILERNFKSDPSLDRRKLGTLRQHYDVRESDISIL